MAVTGPPDFVGVGTNKSGTTWWHRLISLHPDVHRDEGRPKELHHFDPFWSQPFTETDVAAYHARFPRPAGTVTGEWTPRYAADVWVAPLLHRSAPTAKWLMLLRDPWDRFVSEVAASAERTSAGGASIGGSARLPDLAIARSRYAEQVRRLHRHHSPELLLVLQYERCRAEPEQMLHATQRFLGLDLWTPPDIEIRRPVNASTGPAPDLPEVLRTGFLDLVRDDVAELFDLPGLGIDPDLWPSVASSD